MSYSQRSYGRTPRGSARNYGGMGYVDAHTVRAHTVRGGMGLGSFSPMTPCNQIPNGDSYRQPGNQCAGVNGSLSFDSSGNLVSAGSSGPPPTMADQSMAQGGIMGMLTPTNIAIAGAALIAIMLVRR